MRSNLKITNMVLTGKLSIERRLNFTEIIKRSDFTWQLVNEDICPVIIKRFEKQELNAKDRKKAVTITLWATGAVTITGAVSRKEAQVCYDKVIEELKRMRQIE